MVVAALFAHTYLALHPYLAQEMANADEMRKELALVADADLIFMMSEHNVPLDTMHKLAKRGVKTIGRLAALEDNRA